MQQTSALCEADAIRAVAGITEFAKETARIPGATAARGTAGLRAHAEALRGLVREAGRPGGRASSQLGSDLCADIATDEAVAAKYDRRTVGRLVEQLDAPRKAAVGDSDVRRVPPRPGAAASPFP